MLNASETANTRYELQENYRRLNPDRDQALADMQISGDELDRVLAMDNPYPGNVWMVRDYLEDKLNEAGIEPYPFSRLADHSANHWYPYETPWRDR